MANDACKCSRRVGTKVESGVEPHYDGRRALLQSCGVPCLLPLLIGRPIDVGPSYILRSLSILTVYCEVKNNNSNDNSDNRI